MNPCPICNGVLEPVTLAWPAAPRWACSNCGRQFDRCFHCSAVTAQVEPSGELRCANATCRARERPVPTCPQCGRNSFDPDAEVGTLVCRNPACPPTVVPDTSTAPWRSVPTPQVPVPAEASGSVDGLLRRIAAQSHFEERYEPRGDLARGGMGEIFRAFDRILRREVAVKRMRRWGGSESDAVRGQFLKEARVGGRLLHPNMLPVFDLGVDRDSRTYFTMRLVDGATLQDCLEALANPAVSRLVTWPLVEFVEAFRRACQGVDYAHQNGVLHLDLKPQNILVSGFHEVFVIDWGLARVDDEDDTDRLADLYRAAPDPDTGSHTGAFGRIVGTPAYMAPEQAQGQVHRFGPATDVYGLGGVLYFVLYGQAPNRGDDIRGLLAGSQRPKTRGRLRDGLLPRGHHGRRALQSAIERLEAICLRCLEPDPAGRYPDVEGLLVDLSAWLAENGPAR